MIKQGQVRRWRYPGGVKGEGTEVFIVACRMGQFYPQGHARGEALMDHWEIVCGGELMQGWATRTLETESDLVSE